MKITKYSCYSHVGKERANQEDYYLIRGDLGVYAWLQQEVSGVSLAALTSAIEEWLKKW